MQYRRVRTKGGTYFFTVVTGERRGILCIPSSIALLKETFRHIMDRHPFRIDAMVVLPDHLHCIWTLPEGDYDYSTRWRLIKGEFSRKCDKACKGAVGSSGRGKDEQAVWQRRFWEHQIRDENDFTRHVEYIHYNPVKHGLAKAPKEWAHCSFHRYVREGLYGPEWGATEEIVFDSDVGAE